MTELVPQRKSGWTLLDGGKSRREEASVAQVLAGLGEKNR